MKVLWQDHTFVMKCILNALCLLKHDAIRTGVNMVKEKQLLHHAILWPDVYIVMRVCKSIETEGLGSFIISY